MADKAKEKARKAQNTRALRKARQEALDLFIIHGGLTAAHNETGIPRQTLHDRFNAAVNEGMQPSANALKTAGLKKPKAVPYSEDEARFKEDWTPQDCIDELMRIVEANPEQVISRNHFRVFSSISESTWNRYFGTFEEFKRQAGVILSRHVHRHEKAVAKHAAHDRMRDLTAQKRQYEDKYDKPSDARWQTILVASDVHDVDCDPFWRRVFIDAVVRVQPDVVCLNGDMFDLPEFGKYTVDPRDWDVVGRIRWVHGFVKEVRTAAPNAQIDFVEGNHEFRLLRHLSEATPAMRAVLADLHGFTVPRLLLLDECEVNYVARMDLAAWTERDIKEELRANWVNYYDCVIGHHFPEGRRMGYPGWNGHHHKHIVWPHYNPTHGAHEWHQIGAGHARDATFCNGEKWSNGFLVAHLDTTKKHTAFEYVDVRDFAMLGGKFYHRTEEELVTAL